MSARTFVASGIALAVVCIGIALAAEEPAAPSSAAQPEVGALVQLPAPQMDGGRPLMAVLKDRHSSRTFSDKPLPAQELSNLLWAAWGVNRPDSGMRTAPSAVNWQEIDVYVATADGFYLYDAKAQALKLVVAKDLRALTGMQPFVAMAPVNLVFVADWARMGQRMDEANKALFAGVDTGVIVENAYLYCSSAGLNTVVRASLDKAKLAEAAGLRPDQKVMLAQTVGYPQ